MSDDSLYIARCGCTEWVLHVGYRKAPCGWCGQDAVYVSDYDGREKWVRRL